MAALALATWESNFHFGTGRLVEDLSPEQDLQQKQLYVIYFGDSSPCDIRGHIRLYGAFWSAGPAAGCCWSMVKVRCWYENQTNLVRLRTAVEY